VFSLQRFDRNLKKMALEDMGSCPNSFCRFWNWKVRTEHSNQHILDSRNINETFSLLSPTLRRWRWSRPRNHQKLAVELEKALMGIQGSYDKIRRFGLLDFGLVPDMPLRQIWDELGKVKPPKDSSSGEYLVMAVTKPLMFLWGQTPAFDSQVRENMSCELKLSALDNDRWTFDDWHKAMESLQEILKKDTSFVKHLGEASEREYGMNSAVPYGRFIDIYFYWK
jgi:hypothetical protein